jgi:hypothetical protein
MENPIPHMKPFSISLKLDIYVLYLCNILVMGRAAFMRVPVSGANDLNYLL